MSCRSFFSFFLSPPTGIIDPIYRRAPTPPQGYGNAREPTPHLVSPAGDTSPQTGRHRELIPGPPDPRTDVLPTALTRPQFFGFFGVLWDTSPSRFGRPGQLKPLLPALAIQWQLCHPRFFFSPYKDRLLPEVGWEASE